MKRILRHQSDGFLYILFEPLVHNALYVFFKHLHLHNLRGVPSNKPVLLAVNHPTAFMDPLLLCCFLDPPIYNMTRGDIFQKPFFRKLMESVNMFPVFRKKDGYGDRERNDGVFDFCAQKLLHQRVVCIYVEGEHHLDMQVKPIQKGIVRIAFGTLEKHPQLLEDLQVIPIGVNYAQGDCWRDEVMVQVGQPIMVKEFWKTYQGNANEGHALLTARIQNGLESVCWNVIDPADNNLVEKLLTLQRSENLEPLFPSMRYSGKRFEREKTLVDAINKMLPEQKAMLNHQTNQYFDRLQANGVEDFALVQPEWGRSAHLMVLILGLPLFLSRIFAWPVVWLIQRILNKKVAKREFRSSILIGVGVLAGLVWYILIVLATLFTKDPFIISMALALPLFVWLSILLEDKWRNFLAVKKAEKLPDLPALLALRTEISNQIKS